MAVGFTPTLHRLLVSLAGKVTATVGSKAAMSAEAVKVPGQKQGKRTGWADAPAGVWLTQFVPSKVNTCPVAGVARATSVKSSGTRTDESRDALALPLYCQTEFRPCTKACQSLAGVSAVQPKSDQEATLPAHPAQAPKQFRHGRLLLYFLFFHPNARTTHVFV